MLDESRLVSLCDAAGLTLATAESCTGGLIAHRITNVPGASAVFRGAVVAYDNAVKTSLLGVDAALLRSLGAVSAPVAEAMARGAQHALGADLALAVTGIAGPGGGTPEKPVGTVHLAVAGRGKVLARQRVFSGDRAAIKSQIADAALSLALELLEES